MEEVRGDQGPPAVEPVDGDRPGCPRRNRVRSSGERRERGFDEKDGGHDPRRSEIAYITAFA